MPFLPYKPPTSLDLSTSEGLLELARARGGITGATAENIINPQKGFWGTVGSGLWKGFTTAANILSTGAYSVGGILSGKGITKGIKEKILPSRAIFGKTKEKTLAGKIGIGAIKFATDVLLDPLTWMTFGVGSALPWGARARRIAGEVALTSRGGVALAKGISEEALGKLFTGGANRATRIALLQGLESGLSREFIEQAFSKLVKASPELAAEFVDRGGLKVFGKTLLSAERIGNVIKSIPGEETLAKVTLPLRNRIGAMFSRNIDATFGKLPNELTATLDKFRDLGAARSTATLTKIAQILRANKITAQEAETIPELIRLGLNSADPQLNNVKNILQQALKEVLPKEQAAGISVRELKNYVPRVLVDETKNLPPIQFTKGRKIPSELSLEQIEADLGINFEKNFVKATSARLISSDKAVTNAELMREIGTKLGVPIREAPGNYAKLSGKNMETLRFHPVVAKSVEELKSQLIGDEATRGALQAFDNLQRLWKASVTSIFPMFHGRNAISNVLLSFLDIGSAAFNPVRHGLSIKIQATELKANKIITKAFGEGFDVESAIGKKAITKGTEEVPIQEFSETAMKAKDDFTKLMLNPVLTDDYGKAWTYGEIRSLLKSYRVAFSGDFTGFMDIQSSLGAKFETVTKLEKGKRAAQAVNPLSTVNIAFKGGRTVGQAVEQHARILHFLTNLEKTGDPILAAKRTKMFLFDYQNLSNFEKTVARRLIPFYTFTRKNLELQARSLIEVPGRQAMQIKFFNTIGEVFYGQEPLTDEEQKALPEWIKKGQNIISKRDGKMLEIIQGFGTPIEQPFKALGKNEILGSISPILRLPLEQMTGQDLFRGKDISEVNDATAFKEAPRILQDFIGYVNVPWSSKDGSKSGTMFVSLRPERLHLLMNLPPTSRVLSTLGQIQRTNVSDGQKLLRNTIGVYTYGFDIEQEEARRERERIQQLQDLLDNAGVIYRFQRAVESKP